MVAVVYQASGIKTATFPCEVAMSDEFEELKATLSHNLKKYRAERGISQERLALESGVDRTVVSRLERCLINPTLQIILRLSICLQVSPDLLLKKPDFDH